MTRSNYRSVLGVGATLATAPKDAYPHTIVRYSSQGREIGRACCLTVYT